MRNLVASHRNVSLFFGRHHQFSQGGEGAPRADEEMRRKQRSASFPFEAGGDFAFQLNESPLECFATRPAADTTLLSEAYGTEGSGVDRLDQGASRKDNFSAAATDVGDHNVLAGQVKGMLHTGEGQPPLPFPGDHLNLKAHLIPNAAAEVGAILCLANGTGGDRTKSRYLVAGGNFFEGTQSLDRAVHRLGVEFAGCGNALGESGWFPLFVENAIGAAATHLSHQQTDAVAADVDSGQTACHVSREIDLFLVGGCRHGKQSSQERSRLHRIPAYLLCVYCSLRYTRNFRMCGLAFIPVTLLLPTIPCRAHPLERSIAALADWHPPKRAGG